MKLKALMLGIALTFAAPLAAAGDPGFYGAVDLGKSTFKNYCSEVVGGATGVSCTETDTAIRLAVGYQLNDNFGIEGSYGPAVEVTASDGFLTVKFQNTEWQFAAIGTLPVGSGFSLFGKAGIALWKVESSAAIPGLSATDSVSGNSVLVGIGAKYDINDTMAIRAQYETHKIGDATTGDGKLNTLSMGLVFEF